MLFDGWHCGGRETQRVYYNSTPKQRSSPSSPSPLLSLEVGGGGGGGREGEWGRGGMGEGGGTKAGG